MHLNYQIPTRKNRPKATTIIYKNLTLPLTISTVLIFENVRIRVRVPWPAFPTCKSKQNGKGARTLGSTLLNINIFGLERWLIHDFEKVISCPKISHSQCLFLVPNVLAFLNQTSAKLPNDRECVSCREQGNVPLS